MPLSVGSAFASLERQLLRRSVDAHANDQERCRDCGRIPLVGEHVHRYECGRVACELCRQERREAPVAVELVRTPEYGHAVRVMA